LDANFFFWAAAALSVVTFYVHTFIGGPRVAAPLLANKELPRASIWLNYYCWHITTILILALGGAFAYVALHINRPELAVFSTGFTGIVSILSAVVAIKGGINPFRFPSTSLFAGICLLGAAGVFAG